MKILVFNREEWDDLIEFIEARTENWIETNEILHALSTRELKDVVEFEAETLTEKDISKNAFEVELGCEGCYGHFLQIPPLIALGKNLPHWRKFKVFAIKQKEKGKEKPNDQKP